MRTTRLLPLLVVPALCLPAGCGAGDQGDARTERWVAHWCQVEAGMSRAQVVRLMGEPTEVFVTDGTQLHWGSAPYDFTAYLDEDDRVTDTWGIYDTLPAADRDRLNCEDSR